MHGIFSSCFFGDEAFKQLVYKKDYRAQVLHHAATANLEYVLFVVANETNITYATLICFPKAKRDTYLGLMDGVYDRSLSWAYDNAWNTNDPMTHLPDFRENVVSSKSYPIDRESVCFVYFLWKKLMEMVDKTKLPLPMARKIVPAIVARWNKIKGRIDEMTRYLDAMTFVSRRSNPKQQLVMRELKKLALTVLFTKKHCFPTKPIPMGRGILPSRRI